MWYYLTYFKNRRGCLFLMQDSCNNLIIMYLKIVLEQLQYWKTMWRFVLQYLDVMAESFIKVLDCHCLSMLTKDNVLEISLLLQCQRTRPIYFQRILCLPQHSFLPYTDQFMSLFNLCHFFLWLQLSYLSKRYCQSRINHYQHVVYPQWWICS